MEFVERSLNAPVVESDGSLPFPFFCANPFHKEWVRRESYFLSFIGID